MKTAVVHEWLVNYAGSERVLEQILNLYPEADLFSVCDFLPDHDRNFILRKKVTTSFIQNLPGAQRRYRTYLPLMPFAMRRLDLSRYNLIISNSHSVAKGIRKRPGQIQICYCHTPMRYAWDLRDQYLRESGMNSGIKGFAAKAVLNKIRMWDLKTSRQVDYFLANSFYIKDRIMRSYGREADVIYPPVDVEKFRFSDRREDFFLTVSRMVPYKKVDIIVEAFSEAGLPLIVIGDGPDFTKVKSRAKKNIEFLGYQDEDVLIDYMRRARAFIFTADEDFGIVPVEAQACGTPVIAFGRGGVTETVIPIQESEFADQDLDRSEINRPDVETKSPTGIFFHKQTASALISAIERFIKVEDRFDPEEIRKNAERFSVGRFREECKNYIDNKLRSFFG